MADDTKADLDAPPVTQILARFVATHPSRGWSDAVEHEAIRTILNWVGCGIGGARHQAAETALAVKPFFAINAAKRPARAAAPG